MRDSSDLACAVCGDALERARYFPRQLITADDMRAEQEFFQAKLRRHNRFLHGWGIVCGCSVVPRATDANPWKVAVCPGYVVSPQGDEILINDCVLFDLQKGMQSPDPCQVSWPCPPLAVASTDSTQTVGFLAVRYTECATRPVRVHPAGCGCDELDCEYSRTRESFELKLLWTLPQSHTAAGAADAQWLKTFAQASPETVKISGLPVPPCPACIDDPWVVLAQLRIPAVKPGTGAGAGSKTPIAANDISYHVRRVLYSTSALQAIVARR
jgi:hypothetical protein